MAQRRRRKQSPPRQPSRWRWRYLGAAILVSLGAAVGVWWASAAQSPSGGTPRLVVDRSEIDLGRFRYEARAKGIFTLTNAGTAPLRIVEVSPVKALKGC